MTIKKCGHSEYWLGNYGTCMACRAEAAEKERDEARAEVKRLESGRKVHYETVSHYKNVANTLQAQLIDKRSQVAALQQTVERMREALTQVNVRHDEDGLWLVLGNSAKHLGDIRLMESSIRYKNIMDWKAMRDAALSSPAEPSKGAK